MYQDLPRIKDLVYQIRRELKEEIISMSNNGNQQRLNLLNTDLKKWNEIDDRLSHLETSPLNLEQS